MVKIIFSPIDGHVHLRGEEYSDVVPSFAERAFEDARDVGLLALVEEPNTLPYLEGTDHVNERIKQIDKIRGRIKHGIAVAITPSSDQRSEAIRLYKENPRVVSLKTFFVRSTGSGEIEITKHSDQRDAWRQISLDSKGILWEGHYEDGDLFEFPFNFRDPMSHSLRQNPSAELVQFERQIKFAYDSGFNGTLLVKHTSVPDTIEFGEKFSRRRDLDFRIMYETTFHHMFLNSDEDYPIHGNRVKMNPPLRNKAMQEKLLEFVLSGRTHTIGTDHAPHPIKDKDSENPKSGIPGILFWPKGIQLLREHRLPEYSIRRLTFDTPNEIYFNSSMRPRLVAVRYNPDKWVERYGFNPFSRIDGSKRVF